MGIFSYFRERKEERQQALATTMTTALAGALKATFEAQGEQVKQNVAFLSMLQDLSARKAAQVMGSRGGKKTAERKKAAKKAAAQAVECPLCADPMRRGNTLEQIAFHRQHEAARGTFEMPAPEPSPDEVGN